MKKLLLIAALALTACGSGGAQKVGLGDNIWGVIAKSATNSVKEKRAENEAAKTPSRALTQEDIKAFKNPVAKITIPDLGYVGFATKIDQHKDISYFLTKQGQGFAFKNGALISTRGMPYDLMSAETTLGERTYRYLTSTNRISTYKPNCQIAEKASERIEIVGRSFNTKRTATLCKGETFKFVNMLWVDGAGKPRKALQWVGFSTGYAVIEWLN